jgi:hypothetical protein
MWFFYAREDQTMSKILLFDAPGIARALKPQLTHEMPEDELVMAGETIPGSGDVAVVLMDAQEGLTAEMPSWIEGSHNSGIRHLVCVFCRADRLEDEELLELFRMECRELAGQGGYDEGNVQFFSLDTDPDPAAVSELAEVLQSAGSGSDKPSASAVSEHTCKECGHVEPDAFDTCPKCGARQKVSFWKRLFGGG